VIRTRYDEGTESAEVATSGGCEADSLEVCRLYFVPAISYHSENHFRTITISYHCHFVPYADRYIITISYHMQIDTLLQFRTICRSTHYDHFVPYADKYLVLVTIFSRNILVIRITIYKIAMEETII
jgi:hypothetical protein